jgi:molybdopterin synthase sulfur carrier subunit
MPPTVSVRMTRHLHRFFPHLEGQDLQVQGETIAEILAAIEQIAPGFGFYICDERGRLRTHVNIFVGKQMVRDRRALSDTVADGDTVSILQALSGG